MSELEQRLTNELGKLAEQYGQDQKRLAGQCASLAGQVTRLEEQVRQSAGQCASLEELVQQLTEQYAREQQEHIQWASFITELVKKLDASYKTLTDDLNELIR